MSQFIDKLNQMIKTTFQPLGFRSLAQSHVKPRLLFVASLKQGEQPDRPDDAFSGADAILFAPEAGAKSGTKLVPYPASIPWGISVKEPGIKDLKPFIEDGCDFLVFSPGATPLSIPKDAGKIGRILRIDSSISDSLLRTLNELAVDALLIADEAKKESFLTWQHLMALRRLTISLMKPRLLMTPPELSEDEIQLLWDAGIDGVVIETDIAQASARMQKLRQTIDKMTLAPRRHKRGEAILPRIAEERPAPLEEDEEEE